MKSKLFHLKFEIKITYSYVYCMYINHAQKLHPANYQLNQKKKKKFRIIFIASY